MIKWSDRINMITDEQILLYANNMIDEYEKYSRNAGIGFITLENGNKYLINSNGIENINKKLRDKLTSNCQKIISMNFSIGQKKIKITIYITYIQFFKKSNFDMQNLLLTIRIFVKFELLLSSLFLSFEF